MLKCNRLFYSSTTSSNVFHDRILPAPEQRKFLIECRNEIKTYLEEAIANATVSELGMKKPVRPKFRTQGSWAYDTCIKPANKTQEMDWDYGVYLPIDVWESNGPPKAMAKKYFDLVERLLKPLCNQNGWHLAQGPERKATCIRIQLTNWAHMDIPLYAAPEKEFEKIIERLAFATNRAFLNKAYALDSIDFADGDEDYNQAWEDMKDIMMATRTGEWRPSDPEAVRRWFEHHQKICGNKEQLLRICRYLKAWRDFACPDDGPSSVAIMVAITKNFVPVFGRDDKALISAAEVLADKVLTDIKEPAICEEPFNRLSETQRRDARTKLLNLISRLKQALNSEIYQKHDACAFIISVLGDRIPNDVSLIDLDTGAAEVVKKTPAYQVSKPVVGVSVSG